jgi:hypothetical protein
VDTDPEEPRGDDLIDAGLQPLGEGPSDSFANLDLPEMGLEPLGAETAEEAAEIEEITEAPEELEEIAEVPEEEAEELAAEGAAEEAPKKARRPLFGALSARLASLDVYTVALGIAALAITIATVCMILELGRYGFEIRPQ